jgi:hypothetical protein
MSRESNNFSEEESQIIRAAIDGSKNYRIFLLQSVKNNGLQAKRVPPFIIHATRIYNSRNKTSNADRCSKTEFSFLETIYKDNHGNDVSWLARTAFLMCIEKYDDNNIFIRNVMFGGFCFLEENKKTTKKKETMPYKEMSYRVEHGKNFPDVDLLPLELISAPTFVVPDRIDNINETIFHESNYDRKDGRWKQQKYIWIPFDWTCHHDDVKMMETEDDQDPFFNIGVQEIKETNARISQLNKDEIDYNDVDDENIEEDDMNVNDQSISKIVAAGDNSDSSMSSEIHRSTAKRRQVPKASTNKNLRTKPSSAGGSFRDIIEPEHLRSCINAYCRNDEHFNEHMHSLFGYIGQPTFPKKMPKGDDIKMLDVYISRAQQTGDDNLESLATSWRQHLLCHVD